MAFQIKKAERTKVKLKLAIEGPSGSGKTYSSLLIARGLIPEGKVLVVDTENNSASLFSNLYDFYTIDFEPPYTPERYQEVVRMAVAEKFDVLIIDSGSHEWNGKGGCLEIHDNMPGNSWTNWSKVTPRHDAFVAEMLQAPIHIIMTLRSKEKYVQEEVNGKQKVKKIGAEAVQRDGLSYEFSVVLTMDTSHQATSTKDRTGLFPVDSWLTPSEDTGRQLALWLESGIDIPQPSAPAKTPPPPAPSGAQKKKEKPETPDAPKAEPPKGNGAAGRKVTIYDGYIEVCGHPEHAKNAMLLVTDGRGSKDWTDEDIVRLEADLLRRRQEKETPTLPFGESVRDADPEIDFGDQTDLAEKAGIAPDPMEKTA
jgi:hypothetical protein